MLIDAARWADAFDELIDFRRRLKKRFGVPMRMELKANYLLRNNGPLRRLNLAPDERHLIYRAHLRALESLPARAFAVVIDKRGDRYSPDEVFDLAWESMLQRLERTSTKERAPFAIYHDEGEDDRIRRWVRRARRHLTAGSAFGSGSLHNAARRLVDDPVPRKSSSSYFIQMADLTAYAAFRAVVAPGPGIARICSQDMWDEIGSATHTAVSGLRPRSKPGIVLR